MIDTQRISINGKASYRSVVQCDTCTAELATHEAPLEGAFMEAENAAFSSSQVGAQRAAEAAGALCDSLGDLCAKCAGSRNVLAHWQRAILRWFDQQRAAGTPVATPGIRFSLSELANCEAAGYLRAAGRGAWEITDAGTAALASVREVHG